MKLFYCLLMFSLLGIDFCQAQLPLKIKAGGARSSLGSMYGYGPSSHPIATWYGGVATTFRMGKRFFFQPELLYSNRGTDLKSSFYPQGDKLKFRYSYISMPLLLGWHPFKNMSLLLGAEPGYMVSDRAKGTSSINTYEDVDRHFNVDIDLGLSYQPIPRWTVEVRGMAGLIGLYEELEYLRISRTLYKTGKYQGYHNTIQFGLSYDLITKNNKAAR